MTAWTTPVAYPFITGSFVDGIGARNEADGEKRQAADTPFRFSGANDCARKLGMRYAGIRPSEPMDAAGLVVTERGTLLHEAVQAQIARYYPDAQFELKGVVEWLDRALVSGHCDALVEVDPGTKGIWELKTVGAYAFDKAIGLSRKSRPPKRTKPAGPRLSAVVQGGFNALAHEADVVIVAYMAMEAVSVQVANKIGMAPMDRVIAEWFIPKQIWLPLVEAELQRLADIRDTVDNGFIPKGEAVGDTGKIEAISPHASWVPWNCEYCSHRSICEALPDEPVRVEIAKGKAQEVGSR